METFGYVSTWSISHSTVHPASLRADWTDWTHTQTASSATTLGHTAAAATVSTWWDEESPPQLLVTRDISDLPRHVDKSSCHWGHSPEIKEPKERERCEKTQIWRFIQQFGVFLLKTHKCLSDTMTNFSRHVKVLRDCQEHQDCCDTVLSPARHETTIQVMLFCDKGSPKRKWDVFFFTFFSPHRDTKFPIQSVSTGTWSGLYHSANCSSSLQCAPSPSVIQSGIRSRTKQGLGRVCMCVFVLALPPTCPTQTLTQTQTNTRPLNQAPSYQWVYI